MNIVQVLNESQISLKIRRESWPPDQYIDFKNGEARFFSKEVVELAKHHSMNIRFNFTVEDLTARDWVAYPRL